MSKERTNPRLEAITWLYGEDMEIIKEKTLPPAHDAEEEKKKVKTFLKTSFIRMEVKVPGAILRFLVDKKFNTPRKVIAFHQKMENHSVGINGLRSPLLNFSGFGKEKLKCLENFLLENGASLEMDISDYK